MNSGPETESKSSKWSERYANPGAPDCESDAMATQQRCLLKDFQKGFEMNSYSLEPVRLSEIEA